MLIQKRPQASLGFSLIEALISLVIFSIAILALSSLQIRSFGTVVDLNQRTNMTRAFQDFASRVRSNPEAVTAYLGTITAGSCGSPPSKRCDDRRGGSAAECNAAEMAIFDRYASFCGLAGANSGAVNGSLIDWSATVTCLSGGACNTADAQLQISASWVKHKSATDKLLTGSDNDEMVLVFSP